MVADLRSHLLSVGRDSDVGLFSSPPPHHLACPGGKWSESQRMPHCCHRLEIQEQGVKGEVGMGLQLA